ncbi:MAG TPA: DUF5995 family protein [Nitriliruptoraceae bacterium]|nr:DUF5995 family protein [Nitriliruptoraceae bacterium]
MARVPARRADDIDDVVAVLDDVVAWARQERHPLGYFAVLYRDVTATVRQGIDEDFFDDGPRMARLDVAFANRYLDALAAHAAGGQPTRSWQLAFAAADTGNAIVLQHLLVGISAHINLDLGIVVAATAGRGGLQGGIRADFDRINAILASMTVRSQAALASISPWLGALDRFGGRTDDAVVKFSIEVARRQAWGFATELDRIDEADLAGAITTRDGHVVPVGETVLRPGWLGAVVWLVRLRESRDVRHNLQVLAGAPPPTLGEVESIAEGAPPTTGTET